MAESDENAVAFGELGFALVNAAIRFPANRNLS
jgi:hypothetical protein